VDLEGGLINIPFINSGNNNVIRAAGQLNASYVTNLWSSGTVMNWGQLNSCSAFDGGYGSLRRCGVGFAQSYDGNSMEAGMGLDVSTPYGNSLDGQIKPGEMYNPDDSYPMTVPFTVDTSATPEPTWGAYSTCHVSASGGECVMEHFNSQSFIFIGNGAGNRLSTRPYIFNANLRMATASNNVSVSITALDAGNGTCANPASGPISGLTFAIGTTWTPVSMPVNFSTRQGCIMVLTFGQATSTDNLEIGAVNFVPTPAAVVGPVSAPSEGATCNQGSSWLGAFSGYTYFCDGNTNTIKRAPIS
jgi:hypothetical protein